VPRKLADFILPLTVVLLTLSLPRNSVAGPPDPPSGAMKFDTVADGLRKYHKETDGQKRVNWLTRLAATHDIRVQVTLVDALRDPNTAVSVAAVCLLGSHYLGATDPRTGRTRDEQDSLYRKALLKYRHWVEDENEPDLRRRAKELPQ
jgi:hypothetical protein